tara:strand:- start:1340 stop:2395 length:1056 start_codon:yes stop_codon:yes gene_type:complete
MMNHDFGTPMNVAEINMLPNPGKAMLEEQLATSGAEMQIAGALIAAAGSFIGGKKAASAAREQAELQNEATERQFEYDTELWEMSKERLGADREEQIEIIKTQARNESKVAVFKDASNASRYNYDLMVRDRQQKSLNEQFRRSDEVYDRQISLNAMEAKAARMDELRKLYEIETEANFNIEEQIINQLKAEGAIRARGQTGRSVRKGQQVTLYEKGSTIAMIDESLLGAAGATESALKQIFRDKMAADLSAYAQKMLEPGTLPMPIMPYATPMAEFRMPREWQDYDFGPAPVRGAVVSPSAAANRVWGTTIAGIASAIGSGVTQAMSKTSSGGGGGGGGGAPYTGSSVYVA